MKTNKIEKVLIALDYDPSAHKVAETGFAMAKAMSAEVVLLHIVTDPVFYTSADFSPITGYGDYLGLVPMQFDNLGGLKDAALGFLEKIKKHLGDDGIVTLTGDGDIAPTIVKTAKSVHADVIVMGSHSRKWLENIVMGSAASEVLQHTTLPVFIIPVRKHN